MHKLEQFLIEYNKCKVDGMAIDRALAVSSKLIFNETFVKPYIHRDKNNYASHFFYGDYMLNISTEEIFKKVN